MHQPGGQHAAVLPLLRIRIRHTTGSNKDTCPFRPGVIARSLGFGHLTAHGFRSTFRDWAAESSSYPEAVAALAHAVTDDVVAAYRRTNFLEMRAQMLAAWARFVAGEGNVVELKRAV